MLSRCLLPRNLLLDRVLGLRRSVRLGGSLLLPGEWRRRRGCHLRGGDRERTGSGRSLGNRRVRRAVLLGSAWLLLGPAALLEPAWLLLGTAALLEPGWWLLGTATRLLRALLLAGALRTLLLAAWLLRGARLRCTELRSGELGRVLCPVGVARSQAVPVAGRGWTGRTGEMRLIAPVPLLVAVDRRAMPGGYRGRLLRSGARALRAGLLPGSCRPLLPARLPSSAQLPRLLLSAGLLHRSLLLSAGLLHRSVLLPEPGRKRLRLLRRGRRCGRQPERCPAPGGHRRSAGTIRTALRPGCAVRSG